LRSKRRTHRIRAKYLARLRNRPSGPERRFRSSAFPVAGLAESITQECNHSRQNSHRCAA
jgi:hypothetical protein